MKLLCVDASAVAAVLFAESKGPAMQDAMRGQTLLAPRVIRFEIASIALKKYRKDPDALREIESAVAQFLYFDVREIEVLPHLILVTALRTGLTAYDASYLAVAEMWKAPLLTLDAKLAAAALG